MVKKLLQLDGITQYKPILDAISNNMRTNVSLTPTSFPALLGYKDSLKTIETHQLVGEGQMVDGLYYQIPTSEELLEIQNVIKTSLGLPTSTELKTNVRVSSGATPISVINAYTNLPGITTVGEGGDQTAGSGFDIPQ